MVNEGARVVMLYLIQHSDAECFAPAVLLDAAYGSGLEDALLDKALKFRPGGRRSLRKACS